MVSQALVKLACNLLEQTDFQREPSILLAVQRTTQLVQRVRHLQIELETVRQQTRTLLTVAENIQRHKRRPSMDDREVVAVKRLIDRLCHPTQCSQIRLVQSAVQTQRLYAMSLATVRRPTQISKTAARYTAVRSR
jgi:hypothetical protein